MAGYEAAYEVEEEEEEVVRLGASVEKAKSGRSTCYACKQLIGDATLRIGCAAMRGRTRCFACADAAVLRRCFPQLIT